jgi:hypothetical protein
MDVFLLISSNATVFAFGRLSKCFRSGEIFGLETLELLERLERLEQASLRCVQAMEDLNPQVKRKILSDYPKRFYEFEASQFAQRHYSFWERLSRSITGPATISQHCLRYARVS